MGCPVGTLKHKQDSPKKEGAGAGIRDKIQQLTDQALTQQALALEQSLGTPTLLCHMLDLLDQE